MRYEVNTVMLQVWLGSKSSLLFAVMLFQQVSIHLAGQGLVQPDIERVVVTVESPMNLHGVLWWSKPYESTWGFVVVTAESPMNLHGVLWWSRSKALCKHTYTYDSS